MLPVLSDFNSLLTIYEPFPPPHNVIIIRISHVYYSYFIEIRAVQYPSPDSPITLDTATTTTRLR